MRYLIFLTVAGFALLLGCAPGQMMNGEASGQWETTLVPEAGFLGAMGEAQVTAMEWGATATARIEGAEQPGSHGWHIHRGECGDQGEIVGSRESYPPLEVGEDGSGEATAMVEEPLEADGRYYVDIHPSPEETDVIIACGDLLQTGAPAEMDDEEWDGEEWNR